MLSTTQFRTDILRPTLHAMGKKYEGEAAENLILGTIAQESGFKYIRQIGGPALGLIQMEPATLYDLYKNYLNLRLGKKKKVQWFASNELMLTEQLQSNLAYMCAICRMQYYRQPFTMPEPDDIKALAKIWKKYWNTEKGRGSESAFILNYHHYVIGD